MTKNRTQSLGDVVPDWTLPDLNGTDHGLMPALADKKGAVVVFWSSVCSHCVRYDDYLNALTQRHPGLALLVVASRQSEDASVLRAAVAERHLEFPVLRDADRLVAQTWFVEQTPRVFLVDAACRLRYRGAIDNFKYAEDPEHQSYLELAIEALLTGKPIDRAETPSFGCPIKSVYYDMPRPLGD